MPLIDDVMERLKPIEIGSDELGDTIRIMDNDLAVLKIKQALTPLLTPTGEVGELLDKLQEYVSELPEHPELNVNCVMTHNISTQLRTHILALKAEVTDLETKLDEQRDKWAEILADKLFDGDGS